MSDSEQPGHGFAGREVTEHPDGDAPIRMMRMPVDRPGEPAPPERVTRRSPLPGCAACSDAEPCARHSSLDIRASLGLPPAGADEDSGVHDWEAV